MTDSDDTNSQTRPISVAELLAKNGTIGAPPAGGRRRRRRGNSDAVTVAELTGEIPIMNTGAMRAVEEQREQARAESTREATQVAPEHSDEATDAAPDEVSVAAPDEARDEAPEEAAEEAPAEPDVEPAPELTEAELDYQAHLQQRDVDPHPIDFAPPPRRPHSPTTGGFAAQSGGAEQMLPDPVIDDDEMLDLGPDVDFDKVLDKHASDGDVADKPDKPVPSYLRSNTDTLFGGQSVADDLARRGAAPVPEDIDLGDSAASARDKATAAEPATASVGATGSAGPQGSALVRGVWVVV
nr:FUSC family protein [Actinomycetota bacterium]